MRSIPLALSLVLVAALGCGKTRPAPTAAAPVDGTAAALQASLAGPQRSAENRARDGARHPYETLTFFGLRENMTVVELWPGNGWYTEVLAPVLRGKGKLVAATTDPNSPMPNRVRYAKEFRDRLAAQPEVFGEVVVTSIEGTGGDLGAPGSADLVLTFRNTHGWVNDGVDADVYAAAFAVLKPGGVFGVVQHRAKPGTDPKVTAKTGYLSEEFVIRTAEAAGFRLDARSEINANPKDTTDHPEGVWSLPPVLRGGDKDRAKYVAIGESDRMTLRFVKPAS
ncbi:MAG: class I SAM-dependent methyltransferase [bacterium]|nr:class I SAM-dependent methyltransferase [bacterium]